MSDEKLIKQISKMNSWELLEWIISSPTDLTDSYYSKFRDAILKRYEELKEIRAA
jgi:hypothetical protein